MVDRQGVIPPRPGGPPLRQRPKRSALLLRRVVAAALLLAFFGLALWLGISALGSGGGSEPPATPTVVVRAPSLKVVFPEGYTRKEMVARVAAVRKIAVKKRKIKPKLTAAGYAKATKAAKVPPAFRKDANGIEGFLFPATYDFTARTTAKELVASQIAFFEKNFAQLDLAYAKTKNLTAYDVLIIASMVEKETIAPDERPKVAAVIYNRLKAGMPLGIDATIRYGLDVPGTEPLKVSQLESDSPYNTRKRTGLPPTPIASPGLAAMQAAAHPAKVDFLFFVRKPDRIHHFFTASESEFYAKACEYGFGCN